MSSERDEAFQLVAANLFPKDEQLTLFDEVEAAFFDKIGALEDGKAPKPSRNPKYTLEMAIKKKPVEVKLATWMRTQLMPIRHVVEITGLCSNTITEIDRTIEKAVGVETVRELMAADARRVSRLSIEVLEEHLLNCDVNKLDVGKLSAAIDRLAKIAELYSGRATERTEYVPVSRTKTEYEQFIEAELVEDEQMRPVGEKGSSHGPLDVAALPPGDDSVPGQSEGVTDE